MLWECIPYLTISSRYLNLLRKTWRLYTPTSYLVQPGNMKTHMSTNFVFKKTVGILHNPSHYWQTFILYWYYLRNYVPIICAVGHRPWKVWTKHSMLKVQLTRWSGQFISLEFPETWKCILLTYLEKWVNNIVHKSPKCDKSIVPVAMPKIWL